MMTALLKPKATAAFQKAPSPGVTFAKPLKLYLDTNVLGAYMLAPTL